MMTFQLRLGFLIFILVIAGCGSDSDDKTPTDPPVTRKLTTILSNQVTVEFLAQDGEAQLAGTNSGLYWRSDHTAEWELRSPTTTAVNGVAIIAPDYYVAAFERDDIADNSSPFPLYQSQDAGETWTRIEHNFGAEFHSRIRNLAYDARTDQIYAIGSASLAVADNTATDWTLLYGQWDAFASGLRLLHIDNPRQTIWFGGQGAIENGYIARYDQNTGEVQEWHDLLPAPATFIGGLVHPLTPSTVIFSGEGGVVLSNDSGESWQTPMGDVDHRFYWDIMLAESGALYTAQYNKLAAEQPLVIECSTDNGETWIENDLFEETSRGGVKSLMLVPHGSDTMLYLGLWDNGIKAIALSDISC
jgi:BNR/Asp-box repeat.